MRRILLWTVGIVLGVPLALLLLVLVAANIGPGRRLIERQAHSLSGGIVTLDGLSGRFPDALAVARVTLSDRAGPYATLDRLRLGWHPLALAGFALHVSSLSAGQIALLRLPQPDPNAKPKPETKSGGSRIPNLRIAIDRVHVGTITLGPAIPGGPATLSLDGHVKLAALAPFLSGISVADLPDSDIALTVNRLDRPGGLTLSSQVTPGHLALDLHAADPEGGLLSRQPGMAMLDPLDLRFGLDGPRDASRLQLALKAGQAALSGAGVADLLSRRFDLGLHGRAPAMQIRPGISWNDVAIDTHLQGTPTAPTASGTLTLDGLLASGVGIAHLDANFSGAGRNGQPAGPVVLHAVASGVRIPGRQPDVFAATPFSLDAIVRPDQPGRPVDLTLFHALAQITGRIFTTPELHGSAGLTLPQLGAFPGLTGTPLQGHAAISSQFSLDHGAIVLGVGSTFAITGGQPQAVGLIGDQGRLGLAASIAPNAAGGRDLRVYALTLHGSAFDLKASGSDLDRQLDAQFGLGLPDLKAASPSLRGTLSVDGTTRGPLDDLAVHIASLGDFGTAAIPRGPLRLALDAAHLPHAPQGDLTLDGTLDRSTLAVAARVKQTSDRATDITLDRLGWKSASGHGEMVLPEGARLPLGDLDVRMTRLADLDRLLGQSVAGHVIAAIHTRQGEGAVHPTMHLDLDGAVSSTRASVGKLLLAGSIVDPVGEPVVDLSLQVQGLKAGAITGVSRITMRGPQDALATVMTAHLEHVAGAPAGIDTALQLDVPGRHVAIGRLLASVKGETIRLLAPARIDFGSELQLDRLRASIAPTHGGGPSPALIDVAGKLSPMLDMTATATGITPALAKPFSPGLDAAGQISADARLTGTTARPSGEVHLSAKAMRVLHGPGASLPAADLEARADLADGIARIAASLKAGQQVGVVLGGTAPIQADGMLDLNARGTIDLAIANAVLGAQGRQTGGQIAFDMTATGQRSSPELAGFLHLTNGKIQDFQQGALLTDITASLTAHGKSISIDQASAHAGNGTIDVTGTLGVLDPGLPIDLHITANRARPLSSDLLTAVLDADITARGQAASDLDVAGKLTIDTASINIPSSLPPSVAKLNVIRPGEKPQAAASAGGSAVVALDLTVFSPGQMFVRGKGLDAELGGQLHVGGTAAAPVIQGGFDMRNGTFSLAGVNLTFTSGRVGFDGAGVNNRIDPSLDFTAESFVGDTVARLNVGGYADAPKITLSSTPPLPSDQVLALILFQQSTTQLSALQIASVAAALAELSGVGGGGPGVLGSVRSTLGLDRLSIGSGGANSSGASVEAGKYVARGVYVGGRQSTSGAGTQAQVQIDLTKRLKLDTILGTGGAVTGTTTPENDPGSSVGLKYQFNY